MACELGDGLALLHEASGTFYILGDVESFIWRKLASPVTGEAVVEALKDTYDSAPEAIDRDVRAFLGSMMDADLLEVEPSIDA